MLWREARAVVLGQFAAVADAQQHIMRHDHVALFETAVIGRDKGNVCRDGRVEQHRLGAALNNKPVTLQFDIDASRKGLHERGKPLIDKRRLALGSRRADEPVHRASGQQDHPLIVLCKRFQLDHRIIAALHIEKGP